MEDYCRNNYSRIINKNIVKTLVDTLGSKYPGLVEELIPERISYLELEQELKRILNEGNLIKDLVHIVENLELKLKH